MTDDPRGPAPFGPLTPTAWKTMKYPFMHEVVYFYVQNSEDPWDFRCLCACHDRRLEVVGGHVPGYACCPQAEMLTRPEPDVPPTP